MQSWNVHFVAKLMQSWCKCKNFCNVWQLHWKLLSKLQSLMQKVDAICNNQHGKSMQSATIDAKTAANKKAIADCVSSWCKHQCRQSPNILNFLKIAFLCQMFQKNYSVGNSKSPKTVCIEFAMILQKAMDFGSTTANCIVIFWIAQTSASTNCLHFHQFCMDFATSCLVHNCLNLLQRAEKFGINALWTKLRLKVCCVLFCNCNVNWKAFDCSILLQQLLLKSNLPIQNAFVTVSFMETVEWKTKTEWLSGWGKVEFTLAKAQKLFPFPQMHNWSTMLHNAAAGVKSWHLICKDEWNQLKSNFSWLSWSVPLLTRMEGERCVWCRSGFNGHAWLWIVNVKI